MRLTFCLILALFFFNLLFGQNAKIVKTNNIPTGFATETYDVAKQELTTRRFDIDNKLKKSKTIKRPLPKDIIPDLSHFIDPFDDVYDGIWK
jgi:hypothetical protein